MYHQGKKTAYSYVYYEIILILQKARMTRLNQFMIKLIIMLVSFLSGFLTYKFMFK